MKPTDFLKTKTFRTILAAVGALIILLVVFQLGMFVGFRKANFAFRWADSYHRNFGGPHMGFFQNFEGRDFVNGHGIAGSIVKIDGNNIIIKGGDATEKIINVSDATTTIKRGRDTIKITDLKVDNRVVVIGTPKDDGSIEAKIIRLFDGTSATEPQSGFFGMHMFRF